MNRKLLKRLCIILSIAVAILSFDVFASAKSREPDVTVFIDGEQIMFDVEPIIENGRTLVPMRFIFEALDAKVEWIEEENAAVATKGSNEIKVIIGSNYLWKNGESIELDVPAKLVNDRTLVPVRAVSEGLGAKVDWDEKTYSVIITSYDETTQNSLYDKVTTPKDGIYSITQLSPSDFDFLKSLYGEIRYAFEQQILPQFLYENGAAMYSVINQKNEFFLKEYSDLWNIVMSSIITQIQAESSYTYEAGNAVVSDDTIVALYSDILKCAKLSADDLLKVSYQTTPSGKNVLLTTFNEVILNDITLITSKYLAVVPTDSGIRYFTLEYSPMAREFDVSSEAYFLCEVYPDGRNNYGYCNCTMDDFLKGIDMAMSNK